MIGIELAKKFNVSKATISMIKNNKLWISPLYTTPEGLQEYWIQWQHRDY